MIAVDTNVIAYYWIKSEFSELAERLFEKDNDWVAPYLWRSELRNVLSLYYRNNLLSEKDAILTMKKGQDFIKNKEHSVSTEKIFDYITKSTLSSYDCEFVSLAKDLNVSLITSDKKIISSFPDIAISLSTYVN